MEDLLIITVPLMAAWGLAVERRCVGIKARRRLRWLIIALIAILAACIVAGGMLPLAASAAVLAIVVTIEALLATDVIPSARNFYDLFRLLPLDLRILTRGGTVAFHTDRARAIDNTTLYQLAQQGKSVAAGEVLDTHAEALTGADCKLYKLNAGIALLVEDTAEMNELQARLREREDKLAAKNEVLRHDHAMRSLLYRQNRERELGERVEQDLASTVERIENILSSLPDDSNESSRQERLAQLTLVKVLVAYCKRKGMIALVSAESDVMSPQSLEVIAREAMTDLQSIGIDCGILVSADKPIAIAAVNTIYDSFYDCIIGVLRRTNPVLMVYISQQDRDTLDMSVSIECGIGLESETAVELIPRIATSTESWTAVQTDIAREIERLLAQRNAEASVEMDEGFVTVRTRTVVAREEEPDASRQWGEAR